MSNRNHNLGDLLEAGDEYALVRPNFEKLTAEVVDLLGRELEKRNIEVASVYGRTKEISSFKEKLLRKNYDAPLEEISDLSGVRVVCNYSRDISHISDAIASIFSVHESIEGTARLGVDQMGYQATHHVISLDQRYNIGRYEGLTSLKCEVQVRTVLHDAWAMINHQLIYKNESTLPSQLRRDLNNVASLLEIAQQIFDTVKEKRDALVVDIENQIKELIQDSTPKPLNEFLSQEVNLDSVLAYTKWKFPNLEVSSLLTAMVLGQLNKARYPNLLQIEEAVNRAEEAVKSYSKEAPKVFRSGTDYLTKSLGFVDDEFRKRHGFYAPTRAAFNKYKHLLRH